MANAPVLKTGVRKDLGVRIPRPPLELRPRCSGPSSSGKVSLKIGQRSASDHSESGGHSISKSTPSTLPSRVTQKMKRVRFSPSTDK